MFSVCLRFAALILGIVVGSSAHTASRELRVCADPNNLPFSNKDGSGFENRIVLIVARELHATVVYTWWAQRRGFIRETLLSGRCDLIPGTIAGNDMLKTTQPYYRSSYVFLTRHNDDTHHISSLDDPLLRTKIIGVQLIGDDGSNPPPAHALARRGLANNLRGYPVYGDYAGSSPARAIVDALDTGAIDVAIVWGPTAGYFALHDNIRLDLRPITPHVDLPMLPMVFDITMGVRRDNDKLRDEVNAALAKHRLEIDAILTAYGVPRVDSKGSTP
jgi:mxaJ protein